jgi:hypothetical protein
MDLGLDEPSLSIEEVAAKLGIAKSMLNRWHHLGWAACTAYVTVNVPRVGPVEARRWSENELTRLKGNLESLKQLESDRKTAVRGASKFGRALARSRLQHISHPILNDVIVPSTLSSLTEDHLGYRLGVKSAVTSLLKEQHKWACALVDEQFSFGGLFHTKCVMEIDWQVMMSSDGARAFFHRSRGGISGDKPWYQLRVENHLPADCSVRDLMDLLTATSEYDFIEEDPEIGFLPSVSPAARLLQNQLHEIAHAANAWAKLREIKLPEQMLVEEKARRTDSDKSEESGHGTDWSSIYRMLRRSAGLVRATP